jgi:uncharacterized membrane protein YtjA (UPF0391 family)
MLGWTILFALMSLLGALLALAGSPATTFARTASVLFAVLFLISLLARVVRARAH